MYKKEKKRNKKQERFLFEINSLPKILSEDQEAKFRPGIYLVARMYK